MKLYIVSYYFNYKLYYNTGMLFIVINLLNFEGFFTSLILSQFRHCLGTKLETKMYDTFNTLKAFVIEVCFTRVHMIF